LYGLSNAMYFFSIWLWFGDFSSRDSKYNFGQGDSGPDT
jgi:hypothetical protein